MKIRNGFVANSSSSSFCIIGVQDEGTINSLLIAEGFDFDLDEIHLSYGMMSTDNYNFYGYDGEVCYAGLNAGTLLKTRNIEEATDYFVDYAKKVSNIDIHKSKVDFLYGECGG